MLSSTSNQLDGDVGVGGVNAEVKVVDLECQRLLKLLRRITNVNSNANECETDATSTSTTNIHHHRHYLLSEENAASLLSYLAKLRCCCDDDDDNSGGGSEGRSDSENAAPLMEWSEANVELVRLTVQAAIQGLNNNNNSSSSSSTTSMSMTMPIMDGKMARRLLTDGVLPFASSAVPMSTMSACSSPFTSGQQSLAGKSKNTIPPCIWIAKLIKSIVIDDLLPIALLTSNNSISNSTSSDGIDNDINSNSSSSNHNNNIDTTALEILLSTFLTRMDTDESSQIMVPPTPTSSIDAILDRLCGCFTVETNTNNSTTTSSKSSSGNHRPSTERLRPSATASVIAALREFETSNATTTTSSLGGTSSGIGRLSKRRVWKLLLQQQQPRGGGENSAHHSQRCYDIQYIYVDRPTCLLSMGLSSLQCLATIERRSDDGTSSNSSSISSECDFDALPPLVYQLSLLPMSTTSLSSSASLDKSVPREESDKQRGMRLRRMCLEGIAFVLEDDNYCRRRRRLQNNHPRRSSKTIIAPNADEAEAPEEAIHDVLATKTKAKYQEAYRWARYTSLTHLGNCLRSDPGLSKAMLSLLSGDILVVGVTSGGMIDQDNRDWAQPQRQRPFRYARLTPFKLAMGLSMSTAVPRMRASTLSAICDLILEEATLHIRRGLPLIDPFEDDAGSSRQNAMSRMGSSSRSRQPWMDCLVRSLEMECTPMDGHHDSNIADNGDTGIGHVLHCLLSVAKFAENEHGSSSFGMGGGGERSAGGGGGGGCASSLLQSLHQLGFLLIDCVKKDLPSSNTTSSTTKLHAMQPIAVLAPNLDVSSFEGNNGTHVSGIASAPHAAAAVGRFLLCFLFYQSSSSSLSSSSSSLSSLGGGGGGGGGTALCRAILRSSFDKFCGHAPNAFEHALLMTDLLRFRPSSVRQYLNNDSGSDRERTEVQDLGWTSSDENDQQMMIALALTSNYLPSIIDTLSNIPGGGMLPRVASQAISPCLGCLLLFMAAPSQRGFVGSFWKRHDLEDHVNQTFLFAKKCLYAPDVEKRKCAANMLVMLLGVASAANSVSMSRNGSGGYTIASGSHGGSRSGSVWSSILHDIKACLRRSLTQHQGVVRMEVYSSLVALLPASAPNNGNNELSATPDATSPASSSASGTRGSRTPPPDISSFKNIFDTIPPAGQLATISVVSELLLSSLERYITIPNEGRTVLEARRQRASLGVGLSQMEMIVEEESDKGHDRGIGSNKPINPFRFEKCVSSRVSSSTEGGDMHQQKEKGKKNQSKLPLGQSLLIEAMDRINEPLPYLIASCIAVSFLISGDTHGFDDSEGSDSNHNKATDSYSSNEMLTTINRVRQQFAGCTDIQEHLQWIKTNKVASDIKDNDKRAKEMAVHKLATLMLVSTVADSLMTSCDLKVERAAAANSFIVMENDAALSEVANDIEDLFTVRTVAIGEAAAIMSSLSAMPSKPVSSAKSKGKKKKALEEVNPNSSSQTVQNTADTKSRKSEDRTELKKKDINHSILAKNRKLIENILVNTCPATNQDFLAEALRKFGAETAKKNLDNDDSDDDDVAGDGDDRPAHVRLSKCLDFRRYIITRSLLLMSGSSSIVKAGAPFAPFSLASGDASSRSKIRIAASLLLGPLLFVEFCSHCYDLEHTSIETSKLSSSSDLSMAQLALRAFTVCIRGMATDTGYHSLSKAARVNALITSAIRKATLAIPSSADGWEVYKQLAGNTQNHAEGTHSDDVELAKTLLPLVSLAIPSVDPASQAKHVCLLTELLSNCMTKEAMECCYLISSAAEAFEEANCRERLGVYILRAFEHVKQDNAIGVLGIDHRDASTENNSCVSAAISVAMKLNCGLAGNTPVPLRLTGTCPASLRTARSAMGLATTTVEYWPEKHRERLKKESTLDNGMIGIATQVAWAILASHNIDTHFCSTFDENALTPRQLKMAAFQVLAQTSGAAVSKEKASIALTISSTIDGALDNAEFVTLKLIPHMHCGSIDLTQRFVSELLFSISKMVSISAPSAEYLHADGSFASTLLKSTKRMYGVLTKLILSFVNSPQSLTSKETKNFLDYLNATLMPKVSALVKSLQEKQQTTGGKFIAERKIESHGKIAALLVFEKEKLDNALLTVSTKLKQTGLVYESEWLEKHIIANNNPDFIIKQVAQAKEREAPVSKKSAGSKRKAVAERSKKKKRVVPAEESDSDDVDGQSVIESVDACIDDDSDAISLSKLTAEMDEELNSDNDSDGIDDRSKSESESEGEFEFD